MNQEHMDAFVKEFLVSLKPVLDMVSTRAVLAEVRAVCSEFQARGSEDIRFSVIPLAFWMQVSNDFVDAYMGAEDDADLLLRLRAVLRSRMQDFARNHKIALEGLDS